MLDPPPSHPPTHPIGAEMDITVATATVVCLLPIRWTCRSNPWVDNKESGEEGAAFFLFIFLTVFFPVESAV